ncbi:50S ribosomal protein L29 [Microcoleus sp. FACHB-831]|jgi:large subunit ribosomal protein L29|uniref:50S ribosomal protein L29 n=1 Tax=Microcoleus sp. FACHB-831 TaxID=2692827 RepID=UPI001681EF8D|nr:50S ribosomal protein L29 [Microcoleus sp. FACHB-831]MBD1921527.1 50S ribosomal protein L29 [Microcoleus sp. FACHB-831]
MPLPKIEDARNLNDAQLADEILAAKRQLFELRMQQATRRLEKPHQFKHAKHRLAQLMTVEGERRQAAASSETESVTQPDAKDEE